VAVSPTPTHRTDKGNKTKPIDAGGKSSDRDKLIAFMNRSAQVRRGD
jgi:hypothetical protein